MRRQGQGLVLVFVLAFVGVFLRVATCSAQVRVPTGVVEWHREMQRNDALRFPGDSGIARSSNASHLAATALVQRALDLMGGPQVEGVSRARLDMMTQWQDPSYRQRPWTDRPTFERHTDVRDYGMRAWRNTRRFDGRDIVNIVRDSVAVTNVGSGFRPLSVAYVDERDEMFVLAPDRLILSLGAAADLRMVGDTTIGEEDHSVVSATLWDSINVRVAFHRGTGLPTHLAFRRAHPNDFGLVALGRMDVVVAYSNWRSFGSINIPTQWDVHRAGAPYRRMTVLNAEFNPSFDPDSFSVSDELRASFVASRGPMHDLPIDSVAQPVSGVREVFGWGAPPGIVRVGGEWVLLGSGYTPLNLERALSALRRSGGGPPVAAIVARADPVNGGVVGLAASGVPVFTSMAAAPFLRATFAGAGHGEGDLRVILEATTVPIGGGTLMLAPVDLPDVPGSLLVFVPELGWLFAPDSRTPLDRRLAAERARELGWEVRAFGDALRLWRPEEGF